VRNWSDRAAELRQTFFEFASLFRYDEPNDRAIAIMGAAFLDRLLGEMLTNFFVDDEKEANRLLAPERPLGPFGARITACYCLGLIGETIAADLRLVAKIRNRFAHDIQVDFADSRIKSWCVALNWHRYSMGQPPEDATTRDLFQVGVHQLVTYLNGLVGVARLDRRLPPNHGVAL
jgi:DNA-binding MltR family transcriptional regulator